MIGHIHEEISRLAKYMLLQIRVSICMHQCCMVIVGQHLKVEIVSVLGRSLHKVSCNNDNRDRSHSNDVLYIKTSHFQDAISTIYLISYIGISYNTKRRFDMIHYNVNRTRTRVRVRVILECLTMYRKRVGNTFRRFLIHINMTMRIHS